MVERRGRPLALVAARLALVGLAFLAPGRPNASRGTSLDQLSSFDDSRLSSLSVYAQTSRVPVLAFPVMRPSPGSVDPTPAALRPVADSIARCGLRALSVRDLQRHLATGLPIGRESVILTFDGDPAEFRAVVYPVLKKLRAPAALFVDPMAAGLVGTASGREVDLLGALARDESITIGVGAPPDGPSGSTPYDLALARETLERVTGRPIRYAAFAQPDVAPATIEDARRAGFALAFTRRAGPAEESDGPLAVNRYDGSRYEVASKACERARIAAPACVVRQSLTPTGVRLIEGRYDGIELALARGGLPVTRRSNARESVGDFVHDARGVAGINGTFFVDAALRSKDNCLIGPSQTGDDRVFHPETLDYLMPRLIDRPMVLCGPTAIAIFPFQPGSMNDERSLRSVMPDFTDAFLAGAWIVHGGRARSEEELRPYGVDDCLDMRRRAFFGVTASGDAVLGATKEVVDSARLARAAAAAGIQEAVLLDSGFSTSLVYDDRIVVTGHTAPHIPSRPVPHAIVLIGTKATRG